MVLNPAARPRIAMYSHDGFGLGHLRRNYNIGRALLNGDEDASVLLLASSSGGLPFEPRDGLDHLKLPSIRKIATETWRAQTLRVGFDDVLRMRTALLDSIASSFQPDVLLVDFLPAGVRGELVPALKRLRAGPCTPKIVLGLRDILDAPEVTIENWERGGQYDVAARFYNEILVYGMRDMFDTASAYGLDRPGLPPVRFVGYATGALPAEPDVDLQMRLGIGSEPFIAVAAGGGADAYPMMSALVAALRRCGPETPPFVFLIGPLMDPLQAAMLKSEAQGLRARFLSQPNEYLGLLKAADAVVTMGGYNSLLEGVSLGKRLLVLPRPGPSAEQTMRAALFERAGLVRTATLSPDEIARALVRLHETREPPAAALDMGGTGKAARRLQALMGCGTPPFVGPDGLTRTQQAMDAIL